MVPGETVIISEPTLEIVEFHNDKHITVSECVDRPVEKYLDMEQIVRVDNQTFVQPEKVVEYLNKPFAVNVQGLVQAQHYREVPVEMTRTQTIDTRDIRESVKV